MKRYKHLVEDLNEACWKGYKQVGMKKKGNRMVPNCVPESTINEKDLKYKGKKMKSHLDKAKAKLRDRYGDLSDVDYKKAMKVVGSTAAARLTARGMLKRASGEKKKGKLGKAEQLDEIRLDKLRRYAEKLASKPLFAKTLMKLTRGSANISDTLLKSPLLMTVVGRFIPPFGKMDTDDQQTLLSMAADMIDTVSPFLTMSNDEKMNDREEMQEGFGSLARLFTKLLPMTGAVTRGTKATKTKNLTKRLNSLISNYQDKTGHRIVITKDGQARVFFSQRGAPPYFSSPFENVDSVRLRDHSGGLAREIESIVRELKNAGAG
jgi:hypothetical protein|tara:strand:- start:5254 stop:6216 length:963 start_codon:yes stop_codon:yes gene_type:complete